MSSIVFANATRIGDFTLPFDGPETIELFASGFSGLWTRWSEFAGPLLTNWVCAPFGLDESLVPGMLIGMIIGLPFGVIVWKFFNWCIDTWYCPQLAWVEAKESFWGGVRSIPGVAGLIDAEIAKNDGKVSFGTDTDDTRTVSMPEIGWSHEEVRDALKNMRDMVADYENGKCLGFVYNGDPALTELTKDAYGMFIHANPLHFSAFPSIARMEAQIVRMTATMMHGGRDVVGCMTTGGSESIFMSVLAHREEARKKRGIKDGYIVMPQSGHPAWNKAAWYLGLKVVHTRTLDDTRADVDAIRAAIGPKTVLVVASACQYPSGCVDPIEEIGAVCQEAGVPLHVDACLGGWILPFLEMEGYDVPVFDFRVPGVTSISADTHKYGFAPKGTSVVLHRGEHLRLNQFFSHGDWPGGLFASPTTSGSRVGGLIAACWAAVMAMGKDGYRQHARALMETTKKLQAGVRAIPGLDVQSDPEGTVFCIVSRDPAVNIHHVADALHDRGFHLERNQLPSAIHITTPGRLIGREQPLLDAMAEATTEAREHPEKFAKGAAGMYGMIVSIPDRRLVDTIIKRVMSKMWETEGGK